MISVRSEVQILPGPPVSEDSYQAQRLVKGKLHSHDTIRYLIPGKRIVGGSLDSETGL